MTCKECGSSYQEHRFTFLDYCGPAEYTSGVVMVQPTPKVELVHPHNACRASGQRIEV